tara:strand:- start:10896 stop:11465 length:570 start_codon:yes stop_codon:yes gene_type:complete
MNRFTNFIVNALYILRVHEIVDAIRVLIFKIKILKYERESGQKIKFVRQGDLSLEINGDLSKFKIHKTSHLKSNTFIECSGGVCIGSYFHTGKGLTIFSVKHKFKKSDSIPYSSEIIKEQVIIGNFVWTGVNVTILSGITIGEGAIVAAGSIIVKDVPKYAIVGGNPAKIIGFRDVNEFKTLKRQKRYF